MGTANKTFLVWLATTATLLGAAPAAHADFAIGARGSFRIAGEVGFRVSRHRHRLPPRGYRVPFWIHGVHVGGVPAYYTWAEPPPPPPAPVYTAVPPPAPVVTVAAAPEPRRRRIGLGAWASTTSLGRGDLVGEGAGLLLRFSGERIALELEAGRDRYLENDRTDTRLGGALHLMLTDGTLAPYLLVGLGGNLVEFEATGERLTQGYLEAGFGLGARLADWLAVSADLRFSSRRMRHGEEGSVLKSAGASLGTTMLVPPDGKETAVEGRLSGIIFF